jgi:hypothetical protein
MFEGGHLAERLTRQMGRGLAGALQDVDFLQLVSTPFFERDRPYAVVYAGP